MRESRPYGSERGAFSNGRPYRDNLREATYEQNAQNGPAHCDSKTGLRGVSWHKRLKKFQAEITAGGVRRHLGYFDTREAAAKARDQAAATYHGEFVRFTVLRA